MYSTSAPPRLLPALRRGPLRARCSPGLREGPFARRPWALLAAVALCLGGCASHALQAVTPPVGSEDPPRTTPPMRHARVESGAHAFLDAPVTSFGAAAVGDHVYVLGGYRGESHHYSAAGQSAQLQRLDVSTGVWEARRGLARGLQSVALVAHEDTLVRVGGLYAVPQPGGDDTLRSTAEVARYDIAHDRWTPLPPLPTPRSSHMAAVVQGVLYVVGGWDLDGDPATATWASRVDTLDLRDADATWQSLPAPFRLRGLGVAAAGGQLVVVGGMDPAGVPQRGTHLLDPVRGEWRRGPELPASPFGLAAVGVGDEVVATGLDGTVHVLRPGLPDAAGDPAWRPAGSVLFPRFFHQNVAVSGQVLAIGGTAGMAVTQRIPHVERVWPAPQPVLLSVDYGGPTKNRQGMIIVDDWLYLFGGNTSHGQHDFAPENFSSDARRLHLPTLRWEVLAPYPVARQTMAVVDTGDGRFVSVGGFGIGEGGEAVAHQESFTYDIEAGTWEVAPALPRGRTQFALTRRPSGELVVLGGLNYDPAREGMAAFEHLSDVQQRGLREETFHDAGYALPRARRAFGGERVGERYFLVGGMCENFQLVPECEVLSFATGDVTPISCPGETRLSPQLVALGDRLVLVGGSVLSGQQASPTRAIEVYDVAQDRWARSAVSLPFESSHARAFAYRGRVLVVTAHDAPEGQLRLLFFAP